MPHVSIKNERIVSQKIEYNLAEHCNFSCDECSHLSPFMPVSTQGLRQFIVDLRRLSSVYHVHRFRFVGGEPLLNKDIVAFVSAVKESEIADTIEVVSNGVLVDRAPVELFREIDRLTISWYPDNRCKEELLDRARLLCSRFDTEIRVERINRFRRMQVAGPNPDDKLVSEIFQSCLIAHTWYCQTFYDGKFYLCSRPLFTREYQRQLGWATEDLRQIDGIPLHEPNLRERLLEALRQSHPLASCKYCLGTSGRYQAWRQLSVAERRKPSAPPTAQEGIDRWRLKGILAWRMAERGLLKAWPSARLARALNVVLTGIVGD
jgi:GTP 3',8-cyclase